MKIEKSDKIKKIKVGNKLKRKSLLLSLITQLKMLVKRCVLLFIVLLISQVVLNTIIFNAEITLLSSDEIILTSIDQVHLFARVVYCTN